MEQNMEMCEVFHMIGGEDKASYARNSSHQRLVLRELKPILRNCIERLLGDMVSPSNCIRVADLGCSSGPNTFLAVKEIIESIDKAYRMIHNQEPPVIQVFLNDLVSNDFNTVFKSLPSFYEKLEKENGRKEGSCLVAAMPGSFYGNLFPDHSMHFFVSSYSLHWLSQVPKGLVDAESGIPLNKGSIYIANSSPPTVQRAYLDQFTRDFTMFLRMRSKEMVPNGQILATFLSKVEQSDGLTTFNLLDMALNELVNEGYVEREKLDSFNIPNYRPSAEEVRKIIVDESSFKILHLQTFKFHLDDSFPAHNNNNNNNNWLVECDLHPRAVYVVEFMKAVFEPILSTHFGGDLMPHLSQRLINHVAKVLPTGEGVQNNIILWLSKK